MIMAGSAPDIAQNAVLMPSGDLPVEPVEVRGYDFNDGVDYGRILKSFGTTGFQATHFARAVNEINRIRESNSTDREAAINYKHHNYNY